MGHTQQSKRKRSAYFKQWKIESNFKYLPRTQGTVRPYCDRCSKVLFSSKVEARKSLVGHLGSQSIRVYSCPVHGGQYHVTKEQRRKL